MMAKEQEEMVIEIDMYVFSPIRYRGIFNLIIPLLCIRELEKSFTCTHVGIFALNVL